MPFCKICHKPFKKKVKYQKICPDCLFRINPLTFIKLYGIEEYYKRAKIKIPKLKNPKAKNKLANSMSPKRELATESKKV